MSVYISPFQAFALSAKRGNKKTVAAKRQKKGAKNAALPRKNKAICSVGRVLAALWWCFWRACIFVFALFGWVLLGRLCASGLAQLGGKAVFASAAQLSPQLRQAAPRHYPLFYFIFLCVACVVRLLGELGTVGQSAGTAARADFSGNLGTIRVYGLGDCSADFRTIFLRGC